MRRLLIASLLLTGCTLSPGVFPCSTDAVCVKTGQTGGACVSGYCAFTDITCSSGMRWDQTASVALRNTCVLESSDAAAPNLDGAMSRMPDLEMLDSGTHDSGASDMAMVTPVDGASMDASAIDLGAPDMTVVVPVFTLRGATSGLGAGRSTGGAFALSGTIGIPQPRVVSTGGPFTLLPLVPGPTP